MSAIGAIFCAEGVSADELEVMAGTLGAVPHDQLDVWNSGPIGLAAATLHTTAESQTCAQPMESEDGRLAIVFDGYLLNPKELVADLEAGGARIRSESDVEIAMAAYQSWGEDFANRLEGEFSLIIADLRLGRLLVARDHIGFMPLYYRQERGRLIVASDFRTIHALTRTPIEPDKRYLAQIISNRWFLQDVTAWKDVTRAPRASILSFDGEKLRSERYWEPPTDITIRYKKDEEYLEHYREVLFDSVKRVSRADRPIGIAVSGGLDSSSLFCVADILEERGALEAPGFVGYSLAAVDGSNAFELPYARAAAAHVGRPLTEVPLFDPDIDWYSKDAQWHCDLAIPSNGAMMLGLDQKVVEDGARVLINGVGGDEWLQGNSQYYREFVTEGDWGRFAQALKLDANARGWIGATKIAARQAVAELTPVSVRRVMRNRLRKHRREHGRPPVWLKQELRDVLSEAEEAYYATLPENGLLLAKHNLLKTPRIDLTHSMMRRQRAKIGLESRYPMLSRKFIEFSLQTPAYLKNQGAMTKVLHRQAMAEILPQTILDRTTKANFTNTKIDCQFADFVRQNAHDWLGEICDFDGLEQVLGVDFSTPEGDYWAWEIWGLYASAAFLYQYERVTGINPATGVQQDRN